MISGRWNSPEVRLLPPKAFADAIGISLLFMHSYYRDRLLPQLLIFHFCSATYKLSENDFPMSASRVNWLENHIIGRKWYASQFASLDNLEQMANNRPLSLFLRYRESLDLGLFARSLALRVVQMESMFYNLERTESLFKQYLESKEDYSEVFPCCEVEDMEEIS